MSKGKHSNTMRLFQWSVLSFLLFFKIEGNLISRDEDENDAQEDDDAASGEAKDSIDNITAQVSKRYYDFNDPSNKAWFVESRDTWKESWKKDEDEVVKEVEKVLDPQDPINKEQLEDLNVKLDEVKKHGEDAEKLQKEAEDLAKKKRKETLDDVHTHFKRLQSITDTVIKNAPDLVKKIEKGDTWGSIAIVSTMLSGVIGTIPHPAATFAATVLNLATFFINLAATQTPEDPYKKIYEEIRDAVKKINKQGRKIELARLTAPLALTQGINKRFVARMGKQFQIDEFMYWTSSNNFPNMDIFVDTLSQIESYVQMMQEEIKVDRSQKTFIVAYARISMLRDVIFSYITQMIPKQVKKIKVKKRVEGSNVDPNAKPVYEEVEEDFDMFGSLQKEYRRSLNEQKQTSFNFLEKLHRPTQDTLEFAGWYFPQTQKDPDVDVLQTYLSGLTYVDNKDNVHALPSAQVDEELMSLIEFQMTAVQHKVKSEYPHDWWIDVRRRVETYKEGKSGAAVIGHLMLKGSENQDYIPRLHFKFDPTTDGYTKIIFYEDPKYAEYPYFKDYDGTPLYFYKLQAELTDKENDLSYKLILMSKTFLNKFKGDYNEFRIIPYNWDKFNDDRFYKDSLQVFIGIKPVLEGDDQRYWYSENQNDIDMKPISEKKPGYPGPSIYNIIVQNLQQVKNKLKSTYTGLEALGDLGDNIHDLVKALHYCRVVGKCKYVKNG